MTAEDVVLNYQYHMNPDTASAAGGLLSQIETISADGNDRVIFKLENNPVISISRNCFNLR